MKWLFSNTWVLWLLGGTVLGLAVAFSLPKKKGGGSCTCTPLEIPEAISQADLIFKGTCTRVNTNWVSGGMKYSFAVEQAWKQRSDVQMIVNSGWEADCGYEFEEGRTYLVFATKKFSLRTTRCSGTALFADSADSIHLLEDISPGTIAPSPLVNQMIWTIAILGVLSILFVAFVVLKNRIPHQNLS